MKYDYLVIDVGLYGTVFTQETKRAGKSMLVVDKCPNIVCNVYGV